MFAASRLRFAECASIAYLLVLGCGVAVGDVVSKDIQAAEDRVRPALVRIHVVSTSYSDGRELKYESAGSGVIISKDGHLVSNHHVAGHAIRLFCTLADNERFEAELVGTDPLTDIAVLKLLPEQPREFPVAVFGDSDEIEVGDTVLAMGSPMALSQSVTKGIISNTKMVMPELYNGYGGFNLDGENVGSVVRWIGHDAAIYGGNSGGALHREPAGRSDWYQRDQVWTQRGYPRKPCARSSGSADTTGQGYAKLDWS